MEGRPQPLISLLVFGAGVLNILAGAFWTIAGLTATYTPDAVVSARLGYGWHLFNVGVALLGLAYLVERATKKG